jgi:hypothetical protein
MGVRARDYRYIMALRNQVLREALGVSLQSTGARFEHPDA